MTNDSNAIAQLKKYSLKWPSDQKRFDLKKFALNHLPASFVFLILKQFLVKTDYKLKRESTKFFQLANRAYGASQTRKSDRLLRIAIKLLGSEFPINYANMLRDATKSTISNPSKRRGLSESILLSTKQLEQSIFDATGWYQLSRGLFSLGYFRAAWVARENSLNLSIWKASTSDAIANDIERGIQAHLEQGNLDEVTRTMNLNRSKLKLFSSAQINNHVSLLQGGFFFQRAGESSSSKIATSLFKDLITSKNVALVGPGAPHGFYGDEIDKFGTVVRIKFLDSSMNGDVSLHGSRTDITFLGALEAIRVLEESEDLNFGEIKMIITSHTRIDSVKSLPVHVIEDEGFLFRTTSDSGLRTLLEILKFSPKTVKIFGFDFYSTLSTYSKEMTTFYENSSWKFGHPNDFVKNNVFFKFAKARHFSLHDPVSNFCFAQNLFKAGLFDIEPFGKSILELTPYQYVERLEEMLGDW